MSNSGKRKDAFSQELSAVLGKRTMLESTEDIDVTMISSELEGGEIVYTANQDFLANDLDSLTLHRGDQVIVLETGGGDPSKRLKLDPDLDLGVDVGTLLDNSAARHKIAVRPKRKHADPRHKEVAHDERWLVQMCNDPMQQGWVPATILTPHDNSPEETQVHDAKYRREAVIRELVETEEEFGRDIQQVVNFYMKPLDNKSVPLVVRENKELIFGNLRQIAEFHNTVLIEGVKYYANEPRMLGKTFLRLERDFDKHVAYCRDEPLAQDLLIDNIEVRDFFEELSQQLGDDKSLSEHLKLPIQRINDYQLLLKVAWFKIPTYIK
uniref:DH domain-containing protein n=1 Tax=Clastoptera arizonana TaxID=38151 RepID=A0A1B6CRD6_9HEMI